MRAGRIAPTAVALLVATIAFSPPALLVWNTTASLPVGFYVVTRAAPKRGDLLVIRLSPSMQLLAVSRGILSPNTPLLKPVAALAGDRVCRFGTAININGHHAATARLLDLYGRRLPTGKAASGSHVSKCSSSRRTPIASIVAIAGRCR